MSGPIFKLVHLVQRLKTIVGLLASGGTARSTSIRLEEGHVQERNRQACADELQAWPLTVGGGVFGLSTMPQIKVIDIGIP